jgi:hypothetical protein
MVDVFVAGSSRIGRRDERHLDLLCAAEQHRDYVCGAKTGKRISARFPRWVGNEGVKIAYVTNTGQLRKGTHRCERCFFEGESVQGRIPTIRLLGVEAEEALASTERR